MIRNKPTTFSKFKAFVIYSKVARANNIATFANVTTFSNHARYSITTTCTKVTNLNSN